MCGETEHSVGSASEQIEMCLGVFAAERVEWPVAGAMIAPVKLIDGQMHLLTFKGWRL